MPRLSAPRITKGRAVSALIRLYLEEPGFFSELCRIRQEHNEVVLELISRQIEVLAHCTATMTPEECHSTSRELYAFLTRPNARRGSQVSACYSGC